MTTPRLGLLAILLAAALPAAAQDDATALLAKAVAAFEKNQQNEKQWNWNIVEKRRVSSKRSTCTYSRLPPLFSRASNSRRRRSKHSGNSQPTSGAAWSSARAFCSSRAR